MPTEINHTIFKHAPWGGTTGDGDIVVNNIDLTSAVFLWQFGAASDLAPDISLTNAAEGTQGVSVSYSAVYEHPTSGAVGPASLIRPQINEATLEALTYSGVADLELVHTLYVTPSGGVREVYAYGVITIKQGVNDV